MYTHALNFANVRDPRFADIPTPRRFDRYFFPRPYFDRFRVLRLVEGKSRPEHLCNCLA